ncbi:aminotransferase class I/II-fold pyridoxal phosphate-dependent enzyme [Mucisphaera sp.]|uniref:aminotransferase class I/II-fold pyridoxal phosphate-dependent enzyme n=1 Tax=Mucisphaera sp. TaxID=2913024 RepID=UPI003D0F95F7
MTMTTTLSSTDGAGRASSIDDQLKRELERREAEGLRRSLVVTEGTGAVVERGGRRLVNLASNDYLGLSRHPRVVEAAVRATERYGAGSGASRLVTGHLPVHREVEEAFAAFKHAEAAVMLGSGYLANLALLTSVAEAGDVILFDKLSHASLIDAARSSGAMCRSFPHGDYERLGVLLGRHAGSHRRCYVLTDSVFSMDGDAADLPALCEVAEQHGAQVIVDEAHGTGVLGASGAGLVALQGVTDRVFATVSTASKALGGVGGIVTGSRVLIDTLVNRARSLIYTTAPPAGQVAAILAALEVVRDEPERRERLAGVSRGLREQLLAHGWTLPELATGVVTPIVPLVVGETAEAVALSERLEAAGYLAVAIRPPTVAPGAARVRVSLRADLEEGVVEGVVGQLGGGG